MSTTVDAYGAPAPAAPLEKLQVERRDATDTDVVIDIKFCGVCHSDIHTGRGEWGNDAFPIVTGHEIAGVVKEVGPKVTKYKVGDRVGVGCMVDSCRECEACKAGEEQYCAKGNIQTFGSIDKFGQLTQGGYSQKVVVDQDFVLRIPDNIELDQAAPLLCAGVTLFSPLRHWGAGPGKKVAIIGLGGLGHMGVKLASAMGAEVTVLSQSLKKMEDGLRFGAKDYFATDNPETFEKLANTFDLILNTVSANFNINNYIGLLKTNGTLVQLGAPDKPMEVVPFGLILNRRSYAGSVIGGIAETQEMLDFCGEHDVTPEIEKISAGEINQAWDRVVNSDVRYRFVIDTATI